MLSIILMILLSRNRLHGWFACGGRLAIGWSFCFAFSTSYERPCLGRMGPASRAFVLQKLGFGWRRSGLRGRPANRRWGHSDWRVTWCEHMYCYYSIAAAVRPIPPTYTTRALRRCLWCQYNRRVRARSSVDRAPASGAGCGSSSLPGRTRITYGCGHCRNSVNDWT